MLRRMGSAGLGFGQLFALIFGFLITSALIFLFGIWVGRDVTERRLAQEERVVRMAVPAQPTAAKEEETDVDLSFYRGLKEKAYQRLQETAAPVPSTPIPAPAAQSSTPTRPPRRVTEKPKPTATAAPPPRAKQSEPPASGKEWADAGWTVQVNATTNPQQATDLARGLRAKGYDAYSVQAPMRGQTWYRVRVGRFTSRDKAKELETRLKSSEGLENAYVTPQ